MSYSPNSVRVIAMFILVFSFLSKVISLGTPPNYYFDEVYHAFTARQYLHQNPQAYDPWATPPQGVAFEWTHPPLAKIFMAVSMSLVGENAFGWRFSSVVFGTGVIALTMAIAFLLFRNGRVAVLAGALLSVDGLFFVQSRIAMNDSHFLFFFLLSLYFYLRWKTSGSWKTIVGSGMAFGLALACKWTAIYLLPILALDQLFLLIQTKKFEITRYAKMICVFLLIPPVMYLASYTQYFSMGFTWKQYIDLQQQMWWYHTSLKATHPYQSMPLQWIFDLRPVWMYSGSTDTIARNIYNLGNPILFYGGLIAIIALVLKQFEKYDQNQSFLLVMYGMIWIPWSFSPRIMFFYHYTPAVPSLAIALAYLLIRASQHPTGKLVLKGTFLLALIWFVAFYPHLSGMEVPRWFAEKVYFTVPSWK